MNNKPLQALINQKANLSRKAIFNLLPFMNITTASTPARTELKKNIFLQVIIILFCSLWIGTFVNTRDINNWLLENILMFLFTSILVFTYSVYKFSDTSYLLMFAFLLLHIYGAQYVYAQNPLGEWLQAQTGAVRNPYDRIVHFSFGLLFAYPMREICLNYIKSSPTLSWILPVIFSLAFGAFYEMIEWLLTVIISPQQRTDFLGMQGDTWDAQKDMALAFAGSFLGVTLVSIAKKIVPVRKSDRLSSFEQKSR